MPSELAQHGFSELWHPEVLAFVLFLGGLYLLVARRVFRDWAKPGEQPLAPGQRWAFFAAMAAIYIAEGTPLHVLSEQYLASAHMLQHVLLTVVVAPLLLMSMPAWLLRPVTSRPSLRALLRAVTRPIVAMALFNGIYAAWHLPALYQAALIHHEVHMSMHATIIPAGLIMWWPILSPEPELPRLSAPVQMLYLFFTLVLQMVLFGPIMIAEQPIYPFYARAPRVFGLDPVMDQQLGMFVMNIGTAIAFTISVTINFLRWMNRAQETSATREPISVPSPEPAGQ